MNKIFYLTDRCIKLIDVDNYFLGQEGAEIEISWNNEPALEEVLSKLDIKSQVSIILDFVDEDIRYDWEPKLLPWEKSGFAKQRLLKRMAESAMFVKLNWLSETRIDESGREEQVMLMASTLATPELVSFFNALEEAQVSLTAIYSSSFLLEQLFLTQIAKKIGVGRKKIKQPLMLILKESAHSFKQIFFLNGRIRISRQVILDDELETDEAITIGLVAETQIAIKYVYNQKIIPFNSAVSVVFLTDDEHGIDVITSFREALYNPAWDAKKVFYISSCFSEYYVANFTSEKATVVTQLINYVVRKTPKSFYHNTFVDKVNILIRLKKLLLISIAIISISGASYVFYHGVNTYLLINKTEALYAKTLQFQSEKKRLQEGIQLKYDAEDIKASVDFSESLLSSKIGGMLGFNVKSLSEVLSNHPHILMDGLKWSKINEFDSATSEVIINGWVFPFKDAYEPPVKWVDSLVKDLGADINFEQVTLVKAPLDRSLKKALFINGSIDNTINALPFTITLIAKERHVQN